MTTYSEEVQNKVAKQVDFYFSDSNLPKDRFLKGKIAEDPEGYVPLKIIIAFARMREMLNVSVTEPSLVPDDVVAAVASILKEKCHGLQLDPTSTKLRRSQPLANETKLSAEIDARSLFVKPFPHDADIDKLTAFFGEHATVNCVRLRRHNNSKAFKGSVFVEFSSPEEADKVLALESLTYAGAPLKLEKKVDFITRKKAERKARTAHGKDHGDIASSNDELSDGVGGKVKDAHKAAPGGGRKRAREEDKDAQAGDDGEEGEQEEEGAAAAGASGSAAPPGGFTLDPGQILAFSLGEELPQSAHTHMISNALGGRPNVRFVELQEDRKGGFVRFSSKDVAEAALAAFTAKPEAEQVLCAQKASLRSITEEEEKQFLERAKAAHENSQHGGGRGGRGGRGNRGGGRHGHGGRRGGGRGGRRGGGRGRR